MCCLKKENLIAGIDEAGRGAVIGPLVIAGVSVYENHEGKLKKIGVKDSKQLSPFQREKISEKIERIVKDIVILKISPCKIDNYNKEGINLNRLETIKFAEIINHLNPDRAYVDAPENNEGKFTTFLKKMIRNEIKVIAEHKADQNYPVVSAASIIAKVERDRSVKKLSEEYGVKGSGYPSDERTTGWMRLWLSKHKNFPEGLVRKSWATTGNMLAEKRQNKLTEFFKKITGK